MQVVCALKELAQGGHTVIAVMHQVLSVCLLYWYKRYSVCLFYWYKSTNTDT